MTGHELVIIQCNTAFLMHHLHLKHLHLIKCKRLWVVFLQWRYINVSYDPTYNCGVEQTMGRTSQPYRAQTQVCQHQDVTTALSCPQYIPSQQYMLCTSGWALYSLGIVIIHVSIIYYVACSSFLNNVATVIYNNRKFVQVPGICFN